MTSARRAGRVQGVRLSSDLYPFTLFCVTAGCLKGEAAALLWLNVDLRRRWATFEQTKNGEAATNKVGRPRKGYAHQSAPTAQAYDGRSRAATIGSTRYQFDLARKMQRRSEIVEKLIAQTQCSLLL